jgi:oxygen-independent coproporphyrinogen-3 oxidase
VRACRDAGFQNLSIDLMYGLPGQTLKKWEASIADGIALEPEHISCYGLKLEEGTPLFERRAELELPDDDCQADMYAAAVERLDEEGYAQYEISNFARKGFASRHNMKYWTLGEYLGFGASAHSDLNGRRFACVKDVRQYIERIRSGEKVMTDLEFLPPQARAGEYIMLGLRTVRGISSAEFTSRYGEGFEKLRPYIRKLVSAGFAREVGERVRLTTKGFLVSNVIIGNLLDYL